MHKLLFHAGYLGQGCLLYRASTRPVRKRSIMEYFGSRKVRPPNAHPHQLFGFLFAALAGFDDAAFSEKNFLELGPPFWLAAEQEFQIHSKVLEFFLLGSLHDRLGLGVFFQRDTLFVPADGLGLLDQGRAHASEGACFLGQFVWRLVILVETHDYNAP